MAKRLIGESMSLLAVTGREDAADLVFQIGVGHFLPKT
jgi:hypothetical protein